MSWREMYLLRLLFDDNTFMTLCPIKCNDVPARSNITWIVLLSQDATKKSRPLKVVPIRMQKNFQRIGQANVFEGLFKSSVRENQAGSESSPSHLSNILMKIGGLAS